MADFKKYADETMEFVKTIEADGCRFPGSDEEKAACVKIQNEIKQRTGLDTKTEEFVYAPRAGIAVINYFGWAGLACIILYYISAWTAVVAMLGFLGILTFAACQVLRYTGIFDIFFKQEKAKNIISEIPPKSGKTDYTIYFGAHYDSSWCWKIAAKVPALSIVALALGIASILVMFAMCIVRIYTAFNYDASAQMASLIVPIFCVPCFLLVTQYTSADKTIGSPGAMDNLSGIGINMMMMKYFLDHPEEMPENCKFVNVCFASEEAGLKGSFAYAQAHKDDPELKNAYFINLDSIADPDHFEAVKGDPFQGTHFDKNMIDLTMEAMKETGRIANPKTIVNPIGGCDSTPFCKLGVPTLTIAAQNPTQTNYYHTCNDKSDRIDVSTFETGFHVVYGLIKKLEAQRKGGVAATEVLPSVEDVFADIVPAAEAAPEVAPEANAEDNADGNA